MDNERTEELRKKILANLLAGLSVRDIAKATGESVETIAETAASVFRDWQQAKVDSGAGNNIDLIRLDRAINAIWPKVAEGDPAAINTLIKIVEYRSKLEPEPAGSPFQFSPNLPGQNASREAYRAFEQWAQEAPWYREYMHLRAETKPDGRPRWDWRKAVYIAWASMPTTQRWPKTHGELAKEVLGCTDRAIRDWRKDPEIDERIAEMSGAYYLLEYRSAVFKAMAEVASTPDPRAHSDRRLFLELTGDYTPRSKVEQSGPDGGPIVHDVSLGVEIDKFSEAELDQYILNLQEAIGQSVSPETPEGPADYEPSGMDNDASPAD